MNVENVLQRYLEVLALANARLFAAVNDEINVRARRLIKPRVRQPVYNITYTYYYKFMKYNNIYLLVCTYTVHMHVRYIIRPCHTRFMFQVVVVVYKKKCPRLR